MPKVKPPKLEVTNAEEEEPLEPIPGIQPGQAASAWDWSTFQLGQFPSP